MKQIHNNDISEFYISKTETIIGKLPVVAEGLKQMNNKDIRELQMFKSVATETICAIDSRSGRLLSDVRGGYPGRV